MFRNRATLIAVVLLTLSGAAAHGVITCRWSGGREEAPVIPLIPTTIGSWVGVDSSSDVDEPGIANLTRRYTNSRTNRTIVVSLTVGHPGITGIHTPEYCYRGSGYEQVAGIDLRPVQLREGSTAEFRTTRFQKQTPNGTDQLRIFWSWTAAGAWKAPDWDPRLTFLGTSRLYKLYVVVGGQADAAQGNDPQLDEFFTLFLGALNQSLFGSPAS